MIQRISKAGIPIPVAISCDFLPLGRHAQLSWIQNGSCSGKKSGHLFANGFPRSVAKRASADNPQGVSNFRGTGVVCKLHCLSSRGVY
ncbi:hypothetical protein CDAR_258731 [Caerostris darwini]|uniref:Uncharacterized protein n=1 Tax=Caerostris darwini TaxID=1538125 RepID=A0AAV4U806_9ARAC|nr:hypothetical protein CDAR_258731 [Caerostris darwini]